MPVSLQKLLCVCALVWKKNKTDKVFGFAFVVLFPSLQYLLYCVALVTCSREAVLISEEEEKMLFLIASLVVVVVALSPKSTADEQRALYRVLFYVLSDSTSAPPEAGQYSPCCNRGVDPEAGGYKTLVRMMRDLIYSNGKILHHVELDIVYHNSAVSRFAARCLKYHVLRNSSRTIVHDKVWCSFRLPCGEKASFNM